jgi:hypothetical protein
MADFLQKTGRHRRGSGVVSPTVLKRGAENFGRCAKSRASPRRANVKTNGSDGAQVVYWHRELPPLEAEPLAEHVVEASSGRIPSTLLHRDELWIQCEPDLKARTCARLEQEVSRLGGHYAHVLHESIDPHRDEATDEAWLQGRFTYMLYR